MRQWSLRFLVVASLVGGLAACESAPTTPSGTASGSATSAAPSRLDTIVSRGKLKCGIEGTIPGFSFVDANSKYSGLDVDTCRAIAAAIFGVDKDIDSKVEFQNLDSTARFPALQSGEIDLLARNTTWTASRDAAGGNSLEFGPTTFFDGQGILAKTSSGIKTLKDLNGKSICVETGTTTELNLATRATELGIKVSEVKYQDSNATFAAYSEGRCEAITSDRSQLAAKRSGLPTPTDHELLAEVMSKEPLGPVTINNDSRLYDVMRWVVYGLIQAEEFGITQANIDQKLQDKSPDIRRFLGVEGDLGKQLGLPNDFMVKVIKTTGNYGEIYDRNIGSTLKIDRGLNNLWNKGGLMYSPPFR
jgi:general L-amino acid transport system substrate-binding protein